MEPSHGFAATFGVMLLVLLAYLLVTAIVMEMADGRYERRAPTAKSEGRAFVYRATIGVLVRAHDWLARTIEPVLGWFEPNSPAPTAATRPVSPPQSEITQPAYDETPTPATCDAPTSVTTRDAMNDDDDANDVTDADDTDRDENGVVIPYTRRGEYPLRLQDGSYIILRNGS